MKLIGHVLTNRDGAGVAMIISQLHVLLLPPALFCGTHMLNEK